MIYMPSNEARFERFNRIWMILGQQKNRDLKSLRAMEDKRNKLLSKYGSDHKKVLKIIQIIGVLRDCWERERDLMDQIYRVTDQITDIREYAFGRKITGQVGWINDPLGVGYMKDK